MIGRILVALGAWEAASGVFPRVPSITRVATSHPIAAALLGAYLAAVVAHMVVARRARVRLPPT